MWQVWKTYCYALYRWISQMYARGWINGCRASGCVYCVAVRTRWASKYLRRVRMHSFTIYNKVSQWNVFIDVNNFWNYSILRECRTFSMSPWWESIIYAYTFRIYVCKHECRWYWDLQPIASLCIGYNSLWV